MEDIVGNPEYLAYKFNFETECVEFLPMKRQELRGLSFLKHQIIGADRETVSVQLTSIIEGLDDAQSSLLSNPPRFIFHTAFCGSTFLSRSLDIKGTSLSLREPQLLLDAANAKRLQWRSRTSDLDYRSLPKIALQLLQKHAATDAGASEKLIIKPINSINNIIPELLNCSPNSKALVLYTDARNFFLSSLRKGEYGRQTTRAMFDLIRCDFEHLSGLRISDVIHMSDVKVILTLWRLQIQQVEQALRSPSYSPILYSLAGESLLTNGSEVLSAVNQFMELGIGQDAIDEVLHGELMSTDAKDSSKKFSMQQRDAEYAALREFYGQDIDNALNWLNQNNPRIGLQPVLSNPLQISAS